MLSVKLLVVVMCQTLRVGMAMQCTRCAPGKFKSPGMLFEACTLCPENTFSSVPGAPRCDACPPFSSSAVGSSRCIFETCDLENYNADCMCPPGTSGPPGGPCSACAVGTYKNAPGAAACDACSSTKTSVPGSSSCFCKANFTTTGDGQCLPCMDGMISGENSTFCFFVCGRGYTGTEGNCVGCASGTYKETEGDGTCIACSGNTFSRAAAAQCSTCPFSATAKQNHGSCACNPGFEFSNDTCTQTQAVYMKVSGTLLTTVGAFTASELQAILLADISAYLNISRDFITVIVLPGTDTSANRTAPGNTTSTPAPRNASNSTRSGRRLLDALPVEYTFTVLVQIPSDDPAAYAQIKKIVNSTKFTATTIITDNSRYRIALRRAELVPGYFDAAGNALAPCPDGQARIVGNGTQTLVCPPTIPTPAPTSEWGGFVGLVAALLVGLLAYAYMRRTRANPTQARTTTADAHRPTLTVEYHLVPVHLI